MSEQDKKQQGLSTRAIHAGQQPDPATGAIMTPIFASSTYVQRSPGEHQGWEYSRSHNPTRDAYEKCIADLEGGIRGFAFASGMAATATILELLDSGDHVVAGDDLYGGTFRLFHRVRERSAGLRFSFAELDRPGALEQAIEPGTRLVWVETPTNPMLKIVDIAAVAEIAHAHGALLVVDNTFATPMLTRPLELGADIVMHSATKYLNGHSDMVGGVAVVRDDADLAERLWFLQNSAGAIQGPFDSFLALRGLKTLALRMRAHCDNALQLARWLQQHPAVARVIYPGLPGASRPRPRHAPDGRAGRRHHQHRRQGRPGGIPPHAGALPAVLAGREPGRRREPDQPPRHHDPRLGAAGDPRPPGHQRHPGAPVGGRRGPRRPAS
jgi:cystathionine gamma-lyase